MSANIQLFVSCHRPGVHVPDNPLLRPIQVGCARAPRRLPDMLHDDDGDNMSSKNVSYCELTGQYWAWKNAEADYYGFLHYRRYLNFSESRYEEHHEPFIFGDVVLERNDDEGLARIGFEERRMREVIEAHDFIAPTPVATPDGTNVYDQYRLSTGHHIEDFDCVLDIVRRLYPEVWPSAERYLAQDRLYACNMFVMRRGLFDEYSRFLFDVLGRHERLTDLSHYTTVARRVSGYLGERLCGIWLTYLYDRGLDGLDLQRVYFRDASTGGRAALPGGHEVGEADGGVSFGSVTRGDGKIYSLLACPGGVDPAGWKAVSTAASGATVPAKVVSHDGQDVLVLPVLDIDQTVDVCARDGEGGVLASGSHRYSARMSSLESKTNTLLRNKVALSIRNCDRLSLPGDVRVGVDDVIPDVDGTVVAQGTVRMTCLDGLYADAFCEVVALGGDGTVLSVGDWVCLGDCVERVDGLGDAAVRTITFSLRVPAGRAFTVWARFPDDDDLPDGFACVRDFEAGDRQEAWRGSTVSAGDSRDYDAWFRKFGRSNPNELDLQRRRPFGGGPLFSVIVPLYRTPTEFFRAMADSMLAQTYARWELVCVNASPDDEALAAEAASYASRDARIRVVPLKENLGITENTNCGIEAAAGDFLCFLDHDDVLEPDALYWYADALEDDPQIDLLYCDEDKLAGERYANPFFKPPWNPDLLLGMNYVCHFLAVRTAVVRGLEPPTREYDGSQDYHMTFRVGERARHVRRVPRVLYHWRVHENSTASRADQKDYALETSRLAVQTHLDRCGIKGAVADSTLSPRRFVVDYDLGDHPLVSIVIPNKDAVDVLNRCLVSLRRHTTYDNYEVVVVENNSVRPETFEYYEELERTDPRARVVCLKGMESFNFSRIINFGVRNSSGEYLLLLNNDTEIITPNWIERLLGPCMRPDVGATGAKLLFPDGLVQHAGIMNGREGFGHLYYRLPDRAGGNFEAALVASDVLAVTGACLMTPRSVFDEVGGMDEGLAVNYNDVDYCLRVGASGRLVVFCPEARLYHYESVTRGADSRGDKALRFRAERGEMMRRWPALFDRANPFGNPNLVLGNSYAMLDWAPDRGVRA